MTSAEEQHPVPDQPPAPSTLPDSEHAFVLRDLGMHFGEKVAVNRINLEIPAGSFYGLVGPNGAGKTTTMSMMTGLLRPVMGKVWVHGVDVWEDSTRAKSLMGVLADGVRLFDRLTGEQLVYYAGLLHGLDKDVVADRTEDLMRVMGLGDDRDKPVIDYSAGMTKKVALATAMIHAPRVLVLDEPFEAVDPVSANSIQRILKDFVDGGGTVLLSSHVMDLVQRLADHVAIIARGEILAAGTLDEVRAGKSLDERFVELVGSEDTGEGLSWLHT